MVSEVTRLWFYSVIYSWKDKYKGRHFVKKKSSGYKRRQQGCSTAQKKLWIRKTTAEVMMLKRNKTTDNLDILEEIKRNNTREHKVDQVLKREDGLTWEQDRIVYMKGQIYIPNNKKLKEWILQENHDPVDVGHLGQQRMVELVKRNYWWPEFKESIKKYVQGYIKCHQNKVQHQQKPGELHPLKIL